MIHVINIFLPSIEFSAFVDVLSASGAPHVAGGHQSDDESWIPSGFTPRNFARIEIRGIVFVQNFSLRHFGALVFDTRLWNSLVGVWRLLWFNLTLLSLFVLSPIRDKMFLQAKWIYSISDLTLFTNKTLTIKYRHRTLQSNLLSYR